MENQVSTLLQSDGPLHVQIANRLRLEIQQNKYRSGQQLPTESDLCQMYGVCRSTVRRAISSLTEEGLITKIQGKGMFVLPQKLERKVEKIYSFSREIEQSGMTPSSRVLRIALDPCDDFLRSTLTIHGDEKVYCINRLRLANGEPMLVEYTYVPFSFIGVLSTKALETGSLYEMLNDAGIVPQTAQETYEAVILNKYLANLLECRPNCPGFKIERRTQTENGETYEYTRAYMRGDRSKLSVTQTPEKMVVNKTIE